MIRLLLGLGLALLPVGANADSPQARCDHVGNDDTLHPYDPAQRDGILAAFARLFPRAPTPDEHLLRAQTHLRCMDGRLLACFTGANLPCGKMNAARNNQGAATYCRANPDAGLVPAYVTGHDSVYAFRCRLGEAEISGVTFPLDKRGFAATVWAPAD